MVIFRWLRDTGMNTKTFCRSLFSIFLMVPLLFMLLVTGRVAVAATDTEINDAIQDGVAWLATQQHPTYGYFGYGPTLANTSAAVLTFENEGHFPGGGTLYSGEVEKGLDYLFTRCYKQGIGPQIHGNPDTNGNGIGIYFSHYRLMYEIGMVMQAIIASNTPDRMVTSGACAGMTYYEVMEDVSDGWPGRRMILGPGVVVGTTIQTPTAAIIRSLNGQCLA